MTSRAVNILGLLGGAVVAASLALTVDSRETQDRKNTPPFRIKADNNESRGYVEGLHRNAHGLSVKPKDDKSRVFDTTESTPLPQIDSSDHVPKKSFPDPTMGVTKDEAEAFVRNNSHQKPGAVIPIPSASPGRSKSRVIKQEGMPIPMIID